MAVFSSLWRLLPRSIRNVPADLATIVGIVLATNLAAFAPVVRQTPVLVPLGLVFASFVPGYALVAALFPSGNDPVTHNTVDDGDSSDIGPRSSAFAPRDTSLSGVERLVLSLGSSVAILSLLALVTNYTPWGVRLLPVLLLGSGFTLGTTVIAVVRRRRLDPETRFSVPYRRWYVAARTKLIDPPSRADRALNVLLAVTVVFAVGSVGFTMASPPRGEQFSEVSIATETDDGDLGTDDFPSELAPDESETFVVSVDNREQRTVDYTVVVVEQRSGDTNETVTDQREVERFEFRLERGQSWNRPHDISPAATGDTVRFAWLVYVDGNVPATPSLENADYSTHVWIDADSGTS